MFAVSEWLSSVRRDIKASYYFPKKKRFTFPTTKGFKMKISAKLAYQYIAIFFDF